MPLRLSTFGLLAAASLAPLATARAADLDENYGYVDAPQDVPAAQIPETKVEFGTGWYVRGDIGATRLPSLDLSTPAANSAPPTQLTQSSRFGYVASLGGGYSFNRWFRADVTADFHQPVNVKQLANFHAASSSNGYINNNESCQLGYEGYTSVQIASFSEPYYENCTSNNQASITNFNILINGYIDLAHWSIFTPYIGAGVGLSFGHYVSSVSYYNPDGTPYNTYYAVPPGNIQVHGYQDARQSGDYYNPAFAAMAGVAIDIFPHTKLDLNYRFLYLGKVLGATLTSNEARLGVRYMIDN